MSNRVVKLFVNPLPNLQNQEKISSQWMNSQLLGEQKQTESEGHSSGSLERTWNVYVEEGLGGSKRTMSSFQKQPRKVGRGKVVTKSDEAFALLMFDNYIDKWTNPIAATDQDGASVVADKQGKRKQPRQRGKYTAIRSGRCKYGGWSREGTARFNQFYKLVQEDRA